MKGKLIATMAIVVVMSGIGCASKESHTGEEVKWPEMETFHHLMASAYHPFKDSAKLDPLKKLADELALQSEKWSYSTVPSMLNSDSIHAKLEKLTADSRVLANKVKAGAPDEELGKDLTALHESFHRIMEMVEERGEEEED